MQHVCFVYVFHLKGARQPDIFRHWENASCQKYVSPAFCFEGGVRPDMFPTYSKLSRNAVRQNYASLFSLAIVIGGFGELVRLSGSLYRGDRLISSSFSFRAWRVWRACVRGVRFVWVSDMF